MIRKNTILLFFLFFSSICFAQQGSSLYRFTGKEQAEKVSKVLHEELQLSEESFTEMKELLIGSAESQMEMTQLPENTNPSSIENMVRRQTVHIEQNMKTIIGEEKFKMYLEKKGAIEKKTQSIR